MRKTIILLCCIFQMIITSSCESTSTWDVEVREFWLKNGVRILTWKEAGSWKYDVGSASVSHLLAFEQVRKNAESGLQELKAMISTLSPGTEVYWYNLDSYSEKLELPGKEFLDEVEKLCKRKGVGLTLITDYQGWVELSKPAITGRTAVDPADIPDPDPSKN